MDAELAVAARDRGARLVTTYGLTESCGGIAYEGRLFDETQARIAEGAIELRGPTLMEGYRADPTATAEAFTIDGWLRTGDAGALGDDGLLAVFGRADDAIRTGAETVWPQEVEAALQDHPKVAEVAVAGRPDPEWGQHVTVFVVPADAGDPPTLEELRDHASRAHRPFQSTAPARAGGVSSEDHWREAAPGRVARLRRRRLSVESGHTEARAREGWARAIRSCAGSPRGW